MTNQVTHESVCILNLPNPGCVAHTSSESQVQLVNLPKPRRHLRLKADRILPPQLPRAPPPAPSTSSPVSSPQNLRAPRFSPLLACHDSPTLHVSPGQDTPPLTRGRHRAGARPVQSPPPPRPRPGCPPGPPPPPAPGRPSAAAAVPAARPPPLGPAGPGSSGPESWT